MKILLRERLFPIHLMIFYQLLSMASLENGVRLSAVQLVEMDSKNARVPAPIPLRLMVEHNVLEQTKRQGHVIMARVLVSNRMEACATSFAWLALLIQAGKICNALGRLSGDYGPLIN